VGNICKRLGIDTYQVMDAVGRDFRINPAFLNSGAGFGGSCFPKDVRALIGSAKDLDYYPSLLESVIEVNELQPLQMVEILEDKLPEMKNKRIAVLGLAFKNDTDDIRESRSIPVIRKLLEKGADIHAYDPLASDNMKKVFPEITYTSSAQQALEGAQACLLMTEWDEFRKLNTEFDSMDRKLLIDGRYLLDPEKLEDVEYEGLCW
jgi:UDPglucose 6-dehydrogenase